jgi:uncharacterized protein (TIGR03083 family)
VHAGLTVEQHVDQLRSDGADLAAAAELHGLDAAVPTCPEWCVRDLVWHTGVVHRWATGFVRDARTEIYSVESTLEQPADSSLVSWFREGHEGLVDALAGAPADLECWTFLGAPSPLAHWARRQAHETAIHRVDAQSAGASGTSSATGAVTPFAPVFAADGVDELLTCFVTRKASDLRSEKPATLRVRATDADGDWTVRITADPAVTTRGASSDADCTVSGPASDLYLLLWNRAGPGALDVEGDRNVLGLFNERMRIRWR